MKVRAKQNKGFRPVNVKLRFDNAVEYACFNAVMGSGMKVSELISQTRTGMVVANTGVDLSSEEVRCCIKSILNRIWNHLDHVGGK